MSKYGLDALPYHTEETRTTWKDSSIRNWLNTDFINIAFSAEERAAILSTQLDNSSSQSSYGRDGGDSTIDQVFLLSYAEANKYLNVRDGNMKPRVSPTEYAKSHAAFSSDKEKTSDGDAAGWWWLRSLGMAVKHAGFVSYTGAAGTSIFTGGWGQGCVRPAVWVDLRLLPNGD